MTLLGIASAGDAIPLTDFAALDEALAQWRRLCFLRHKLSLRARVEQRTRHYEGWF